MSNGLAACGWVEYWEPNVALGSLKGMVAGIDWTTDPNVSVVSFPGFPSGKGCEIPSLVDQPLTYEIFTDRGGVLSEFGATDFLCVGWSQFPATGLDFANNYFIIGEDNTNGFDFKVQAPNYEAYGELPGSDNSYPTVETDDNILPRGVPFCAIIWWVASEKTVRLQIDGGTIYEVISPVAAGPSDATNRGHFYGQGGFDPGNIVLSYFGDQGVCKAPIPDATQRALLFGGLPFSQWDDGSAVNSSSSTGGRSGIVIAPDQRLPQGITVTSRDLRRATPIRSYGRGRR